MYPASVEYLNRQRITPNRGGGFWEQWYIYFFPFFSFCECVCVCFCVWFCLYSFAFTICPRVLSVILFIFYYLKNFFLNNYFLLFILITLFYFTLLYFILFYLLLSSFLSFISPFYSEGCGGQALGAPARRQGCASEVGEPTSGHWSTRDLPAPCNIKRWKSPRDLHLNTKTQLHSTTSKLQYRTPYAKQRTRQEYNPIH